MLWENAMGKDSHDKFGNKSLKSRLFLLIFVALVPILGITIQLIVSLINYSKAYDEIVSNMTIANSYNLDFKENIDESSYKLVVGAVTYESISRDETFVDPYKEINEFREVFRELMRISTDKNSRYWLASLLRKLDTLEERENDIRNNLKEGGHYDENITMLDGDIYILTDLIQDDLQHYIYYQAQNIESLKIQLNDRVRTYITVVALILLVVSVIILIITIEIGTGITKPIRQLQDVTKEIAEGDFSVKAPGATTKEINELALSVNEMAEKLEVYVEQIKEDEGKLRRGELRLLQEQINPHFLYNTLDTIIWLIEGNMTKEAEDMVVALSDFFRLILNHGKDVYSIENEQRHIKSYLQIQKVRYQDILEYEVAIPEELLEFSVLKLTLQPIVENALYHGIKYKRAKGTITISGYMKDQNVVLVVEDNGVGMDVEELEVLRTEIQRPCQDTEKGFGLANVNERIRMFYGPEYGLHIESEKGVGTKVTVTIPAIRPNQEEEDV